MTENQCEASVCKGGKSVAVHVIGEINAFAEDRLNAAYAEVAADAPRAMILKFSRVDYINRADCQPDGPSAENQLPSAGLWS